MAGVYPVIPLLVPGVYVAVAAAPTFALNIKRTTPGKMPGTTFWPTSEDSLHQPVTSQAPEMLAGGLWEPRTPRHFQRAPAATPAGGSGSCSGLGYTRHMEGSRLLHSSMPHLHPGGTGCRTPARQPISADAWRGSWLARQCYSSTLIILMKLLSYLPFPRSCSCCRPPFSEGSETLGTEAAVPGDGFVCSFFTWLVHAPIH